MSESGTVSNNIVQFFLIIIVVMGKCCYYKYGYCYYCSPGKVIGTFCFVLLLLYIVIRSPAGQRRNVTMVEMNPSLHAACDELDQGAKCDFREFLFTLKHLELQRCRHRITSDAIYEL